MTTTRNSIWRWMPLILALLVGALLAGGIYLARDDNRDALPSTLIGRKAPDYKLPDLHRPDKFYTPRDFAGAPYLLNVWGSWCPECRVEHPILTAFAEKQKIKVVGYNWRDERADALRWLEQFGNPYYAVMVDSDSRTAIDFGIYGAPETFLIDGKGVVRWKHVGPLSQEIIDSEVMPLLTELASEAPGLFK